MGGGGGISHFARLLAPTVLDQKKMLAHTYIYIHTGVLWKILFAHVRMVNSNSFELFSRETLQIYEIFLHCKSI